LPAVNNTKLQENDISVYVNGERIEFQQYPVNINDNILAPIRNVTEKLDCTVTWDASTQTIRASSR
jgi:hypothetical protein